jgi:hypothetical protein
LKHAIDPKDRPVAQSVLYFFLGRIDDRTTAEQLMEALKEQGRLINDGNATPLMEACLQEMNAKARMLESAARQVQREK